MKEATPLGFEQAGTGPALILVHPFPFDRTFWQEQMGPLSRIRRVIAVDLPGRGKSLGITPADRTIDDYADMVGATLESQGLASADFAGISMGGYILFSLWRRNPDMVRSLTFLSTRSTEDPPEGRAGRARVAALVEKEGTQALVSMMLPKLLSTEVSADIKGKARTMIEQLPAAAAAADSLAMRTRPDSTSDLPHICVPTLVIHGDQDEVVPIETAGQMASAIPNAKFVVVPKAGHLTALESPAVVNQALFDFLGLARSAT